MAADEGANKIYTKAGDKGKTSLVGGARVSKGDLRLEAYGTVDELNSVIGVLVCEVREPSVLSELARVQNELFNVGSVLACEDVSLRAKMPLVSETDILVLEQAMDRYSSSLKPLRNFILPGGSRAAACAHVARTVCRRSERLCVRLIEHDAQEDANELVVVRYLNRLSDYFFVLARHLNALAGVDEPVWSK